MKKLLFTGIFFTLFFALNAQVTLDKRYDYSTSIVKLETQGYKYFLMDVPSSECRIYNLDHSLFKTINCAVPNNYYLADIKYISENLFDNDDGIELIYTYYKYNTAQAYYEYGSKIINEDGSEIISAIEGARYIYINKTDDNTYQLFAYCYDYSATIEKVWTNIYNLPGAPIVSAYLQKDEPNIMLNAFPNPATQTVKVAYSLPENVDTGKLYIFDNNGKAVNQYIIDNHTDFLSLDVSGFNSGVYHYFIEYENRRTSSKKLVIQ